MLMLIVKVIWVLISAVLLFTALTVSIIVLGETVIAVGEHRKGKKK